MTEEPLPTAAREADGIAFVTASELLVDPAGAAALEDAFRSRLGEVEQHPGFLRLEVWRDERTAGGYLMVSWWQDEQAFRTYMRSDRHAASHARIPVVPARARGIGLRRYTLIAT